MKSSWYKLGVTFIIAVILCIQGVYKFLTYENSIAIYLTGYYVIFATLLILGFICFVLHYLHELNQSLKSTKYNVNLIESKIIDKNKTIF